jgi:aryl-alcohol dehydrogenase
MNNTTSASVIRPRGHATYPLTIDAAVARTKGGPFVIESVLLAEPRTDEILVRLVAVGMCHTDLAVIQGELPTPLPVVLGHEGAGMVEAVGARVTSCKPGDHVVLTYMSCGECQECDAGASASCASLAPLCFGGCRPDGTHALSVANGPPLSDRFFGQSSFATYAVAHERNVVKVREDAPLELLGPLGCGVMTGAGAVWNSLSVAPGSSFAVFGAGAVGLSAAMAARAAGAKTIICIDRVPSRLELALQIGATHVIDSRETNVIESIRATTKDGVDNALDTTGRADVIEFALAALRQRGKLALVAISHAAGEHKIDLATVILGCKHIVGVVEGAGSAKAMIPRLIDLHMQGRFPFDKLVKFYPMAQINEAAADSLSGKTIKPVLRL